MPRTRFVSVLLVLGLAATGCGRKPAAVDTKIGLIAELTGDIPAVGASCKNAAELAVTQINEAGGLDFGGGRHGVALVIEDSKGKADEAAAAVGRLVEQDQVLAIVGPNASLGAIPAADVAESRKILLISPWSTNPQTTVDASGKPKRWVFRVGFTDAFEGPVLAKFAQGYMHAGKAGVLYDETSAAPRSQAELFKKDFEQAGGKVVAFETYKTGEKDFTPQFKRIQAAAPDLVFLPSYYNDVPLQLKQAHEIGLKVPFLGSDNWGNPEFLKGAGKDAEGAFFCTHYSPDAKSEITGRFVVSYKKRYGQTPDDVAALTYDAFSLLSKAIMQAGKIDREAVRDAFAKISEAEGVTGKMKYPPGSGDPFKTAVMMQVQGGKFVFVTNIDF